MNMVNPSRRLALVLALVTATLQVVSGHAHLQAEPEQPVEPADVYPFYLQSPLDPVEPAGGESGARGASKRANLMMLAPSGQRGLSAVGATPPVQSTVASIPSQSNLVSGSGNNNNNNSQPPPVQQQPMCLYDQSYLTKLDQCLVRKPYPTIGLSAFKNDDLLIRRGLSDKFGCSFMLSNGHFKSYSLSKFSVQHGDSQCLEQDQAPLINLAFSNITLFYLWQLRCLNYANQLLDDATLDGTSLPNGIHPNDESANLLSHSSSSASTRHNLDAQAQSICVGSSQSFGFAALQLSSIESQVELSIDIYKNWRVTNVTVAMVSPALKLSSDQHTDFAHDQQQQSFSSNHATSIKDFTFDTMDGDELNWRYSHLYENWTRNRLHVNFLDQFKRFLWVSLQRCLSESSEKLPIKLNDIFSTHKYSV